MKNDGKAAEKAFENHWTKVGHCERYRDKKDLMGLNKNMRLADFAKPADFAVSKPGVGLHYAEVKSTTDALRFSFSMIQPKQSEAALKEARFGNGDYIFYIFSYPKQQWFMLPCRAYDDLLESGRRSVLFEELYRWSGIR